MAGIHYLFFANLVCAPMFESCTKSVFQYNNDVIQLLRDSLMTQKPLKYNHWRTNSLHCLMYIVFISMEKKVNGNFVKRDKSLYT